MGTVIQITPDNWLYLKLLKDNQQWYNQQPDRDTYLVAQQKEKKLFQDCINENSH